MLLLLLARFDAALFCVTSSQRASMPIERLIVYTVALNMFLRKVLGFQMTVCHIFHPMFYGSSAEIHKTKGKAIVRAYSV